MWCRMHNAPLYASSNQMQRRDASLALAAHVPHMKWSPGMDCRNRITHWELTDNQECAITVLNMLQWDNLGVSAADKTKPKLDCIHLNLILREERGRDPISTICVSRRESPGCWLWVRWCHLQSPVSRHPSSCQYSAGKILLILNEVYVMFDTKSQICRVQLISLMSHVWCRVLIVLQTW